MRASTASAAGTLTEREAHFEREARSTTGPWSAGIRKTPAPSAATSGGAPLAAGAVGDDPELQTTLPVALGAPIRPQDEDHQQRRDRR